MSITTTLVTSGGNHRLTRENEKPMTISTTAAARHAPNTAARPARLPTAMLPPTNAMLVPMTIGIRPPTGPIGYAWTSVETPATRRTAWTRIPVCPAANPSAPAMRRGGVMLPRSIATRC
jgi:hypothetical protein